MPSKAEEKQANARPLRSFRLWLTIGLGLSLWLGLPAYLWVTEGWQAVEKALTRFAMPLGAIWSLSLLLGMIAFARRLPQARAYFAITLLLGLAGNQWIAGRLVASVERPITPYTKLPLPQFSTVILLGGSTRLDANGEPELSWDGQRLLTAAQMYHSGQTQKIVATGGKPVFFEDQISHAEQSKKLLLSIGVPARAVICLGGSNTSEELEIIKAWVDSDSSATDGKPIGIISTGTHLPRAVTRARNLGLELRPIPCLVSKNNMKLNLADLIPDAGGLSRCTEALYELLAQAVGH
mgnify:CR=1 FL=1